MRKTQQSKTKRILCLGRWLTDKFNRRGGNDYESLLEKCRNSHIEKLYLEAAYSTLCLYGDFQAQTPIGPYVADFTLTGMAGAPLLKIVIECDGHDFHSSKDQRDHDTERDRYLYGKGWQVIHFTGRKIVRDPSLCVSQTTVLVRSYLRVWRGIR